MPVVESIVIVIGGEAPAPRPIECDGTKSMNKADAFMSKPASATRPFGLRGSRFPEPLRSASGNAMTAWPEYMVDAFQRSVLFLDLLRQRGNEEIEITSRPMATVLSFGHEVLMDGRSLPRPINYTLSRILATARGRDRSAQAAGRGGRPARRPGAGYRRLQGGERDRRCPECGPSGLLHRLRGDARTRPAVP